MDTLYASDPGSSSKDLGWKQVREDVEYRDAVAVAFNLILVNKTS